MKNKLKRLLLSLLTLCSPLYAAETFTLDPNHSYVIWHINHFGFSTQTGKWYANGTLTLDKDKPANSKVDVKINVADMVTGLPALDKHLKSEEFFDVGKYPVATFISNKVEVTSDTTATVYGTLTLHGVSKPVTLDVKLNKSGVNPASNKMTAGFAATGQVKRSDFGINAYLPGLGDEVALTIETEANLTNKK